MYLRTVCISFFCQLSLYIFMPNFLLGNFFLLTARALKTLRTLSFVCEMSYQQLAPNLDLSYYFVQEVFLPSKYFDIFGIYFKYFTL